MTSQDSGRQYKTFRGLEADLEPKEYEGKPGRSLHLFLGNNSLTSLSAHRNTDGTYSGTLGLRSGGEGSYRPLLVLQVVAAQRARSALWQACTHQVGTRLHACDAGRCDRAAPGSDGT